MAWFAPQAHDKEMMGAINSLAQRSLRCASCLSTWQGLFKRLK